jgi:hypothetical protein
MKTGRPLILQAERDSTHLLGWQRALVASVAAMMLAISSHPLVFAQSSTPRGITLYEDAKTGALYRKPGRGRLPVTLGFDEPAPAHAAVAQQVQEVRKSNEELRAEFNANQQALIKQNAELQTRVDKIEPAWSDYLANFRDRFRVGTVVYSGYKMYTHTGFGPQQYDNNQWPGPGNNLYNTFDIDRAYLNFYFYPTPDWTLRLTPDVYKTYGTATPTANSHNSSVSSNLAGDLGYRLKFASIQYNKILDWAGDAAKGNVLQIGAIPNPLIPWEEHLSTFRYVTSSPWNYAGLSSAQFGLSIGGPIKYHELTYIDYAVGAFTNAKYSQLEQSNTKQAMGRVSVYPFGASWDTEGLGLTGFYDYGYNNNPPDNASLNTGFGPNPSAFGHVANAHLTRWAAILHYTAEEWGIAGEYDQGHNSFPGANLFTGNGPTVFFTPPAAASPSGGTANPYTVPYYNFSALTAALLGNSRTVQRGFDVFGHYHIPETPLRLIGLFQWFEPNSKVNRDPLDFYRYMVGVEWQINEFVRLAIDTQNLNFYQSQEPFSTAYANTFGNVFLPIKNTTSKTSPSFQPPKTVTNAVPRDTHAIELNLEFAF